MRNYATLFDSRYAPQGLALYESLRRHSSEPFKLWTLPLDSECKSILEALNLEHMIVLDLQRFERTMRLIEIRKTRTWAEYCWGAASQLCEYLMRFLSEVSYCDADLYFYADPAPIFDEIGARSIAITPHRFPDNSEKARLEKSGKFNVGFLCFKSTAPGRNCLAKWAAQVRERCSAEIGCGDQCYLDSFEQDYGDEVCILGPVVNLGPWSLMSHELSTRGGQVYIGADRLVCYHMHEYKHGQRLTHYPLRQIDKDLIYAPYRESVQRQQERIEAVLCRSVV